MRCALVFHLVATIFGIVYSAQLCVIKDYGGDVNIAFCTKDHIKNTFDFIPPISQNITFIDLRGQPLNQLPYNAFPNLSNQRSISNIWLPICQISHIDAGALVNLHKLSTIDLAHNDISQIDSKLFRDTKQLKYIYMEHNKIEVLPSGLFENLLRLERVHLRHNRIRQVEWNSFKNTPSLRLIDLTYNQIEFINVSFKDRFDNLTYLWLHNNPWKCDCKLGPIYELLLKTNQLYDNHEALVCEKPPTLQGIQWRHISRDDFVCPSEDAT